MVCKHPTPVNSCSGTEAFLAATYFLNETIPLALICISKMQLATSMLIGHRSAKLLYEHRTEVSP